MNVWEVIVPILVLVFFIWMFYCLYKQDRHDEQNDD